MAKNISPSTTSGKTPEAKTDDVSRFLKRAERLRVPREGNGGLIFSLDATMSREQTWDQAQKIQAEMFHSVAQTGGLDVQLVYFRALESAGHPNG